MICAFTQDLKKEVDQHRSAKTKTTTLGNQLVRARPTDIDLQHRVANIDQSWLVLMSQLPNNEELLHAAQMELLPSRQALNELVMWMDGVDAGLVEDDRLVAASVVDVQILVQKYRVRFFILFFFFGLFPTWGRHIKFSISTFSGLVLLLPLLVSSSCLFL